MRNKLIVLIIIAFLLYLLLFPIMARSEELNEEIPLPETIQLACIESGHEFGICPELLMALVYQESRGLVDNVTQITSANWYREGIKACHADDYIKNPYQNIDVCAYYISKWFENYGDGDVYLILEMWNEGVENAIKTHNPEYPSSYATEIVNRSMEWEILNESNESIKP